MRRKIVAGNWKMNKTFSETEEFLFAFSDLWKENPVPGVTVVICPPALFLELATDIAVESSFYVGSQNLYPADSGAFTGEISAPMLASVGVDFCIIGHSERRKYFREDDDFLADKVKAALAHDLIPIFCCGEVLAEREQGIHKEVVDRQLTASLFHLDPADFGKVVIAYEPVWAIGTGVNASPEQAREMHAWIRERIAARYGQPVAADTSILYGGSCTSANAPALFSQPDVDGGLIGGASLKPDEFLRIIQSV